MIYVSSSCVSHRKICETILELAKAGIRNIELSGGTMYYDEIEEDLILLKKQYGLHYVCHSYFPPAPKDFVVNLASCDDTLYEASLAHYRRCLQLLEHIDCHVLSIHAGFLMEVHAHELGNRIAAQIIYNEEEAYRRFVDAYREISLMCKRRGITFYLENNVLSAENYKSFNHKNLFMMTDSDSIAKMKKSLDFNLLLDLGHLHVSANTLGLDYEEECGKLIPQAEWFHVSQNNGIADQHLPLSKNGAISLGLHNVVETKKNITLETVGTIQGILESKEILKQLIG